MDRRNGLDVPESLSEVRSPDRALDMLGFLGDAMFTDLAGLRDAPAGRH